MRDISKVVRAQKPKSRRNPAAVRRVTKRGKNRRITTRQSAGAEQASSGIRWPMALFSWCVACMAVSGAGMGVLYGLEALRSNARFQVRTIELEGQERTRQRDVGAYAGVKVGDFILDVDLDAAAANLRRHPWISSVGVRRRLPDSLQIQVREHKPGLLVSLGDLYMANEQGYVFKKLASFDDVLLPVLTGLRREWVAKEPDEAAELIRQAKSLGDAFQRVAPTLGALDEIHWHENLGFSIVVAPAGAPKGGMRIHLGRTPSERLSFAEQAYARLLSMGKTPQVLWVDGEKSPYRVHARLQQGTAVAAQQTLIAKAR